MAKTADNSLLVTIKDVAQLLACSQSHVKVCVERGAIPAPIKLGHLLRWRRREIDAWLEQESLAPLVRVDPILTVWGYV